MKSEIITQGIGIQRPAIIATLLVFGNLLASCRVFALDTLAIVRTNSGVALHWQFPGVVQNAGAVTGAWADLPQAVASLTAQATNTSTFFRVRKPLFEIVDTRSPATTATAAIDTNYFTSTGITNEAGQPDYPYLWSGTTLLDGGPNPSGTTISFGRAMGYMNGSWLDVHGAGSQKCDIMLGNPANYPYGRGPQGDAVRIYNFVRLVRGGITAR